MFALVALIVANILMISIDSPAFRPTAEGFAEFMQGEEAEGFSNYAGQAAGAKNSYVPMGQFDGLKVATGNSSSWRYTSPNEPQVARDQPLGPDNMFMFKNNQCKPSCCGASFSCSGGCVCTTPEQRDFINSRGGNRTKPETGV
jgi:hypothetical protein